MTRESFLFAVVAVAVVDSWVRSFLVMKSYFLECVRRVIVIMHLLQHQVDSRRSNSI